MLVDGLEVDQLACRDLVDLPACREAILPDQQDLVVVEEGHHRGGARMPDEIERHMATVGERHLLGHYLDHGSPVDSARRHGGEASLDFSPDLGCGGVCPAQKGDP